MFKNSEIRHGRGLLMRSSLLGRYFVCGVVGKLGFCIYGRGCRSCGVGFRIAGYGFTGWTDHVGILRAAG